NDWSAGYCDAAPARLRWAAMLPLQAPALAIAEARRAAERGAVAFYGRPNPVAGRNLYHRDYFAPWAEGGLLGRRVALPDARAAELQQRFRVAAPAVLRRADGYAHDRPHPRAPVRGDGRDDEPHLVRRLRAFRAAHRRARRGRRGLAPVPPPAHGAALGVLRQ